MAFVGIWVEQPEARLNRLDMASEFGTRAAQRVSRCLTLWALDGLPLVHHPNVLVQRACQWIVAWTFGALKGCLSLIFRSLTFQYMHVT